MTTAPSFVYLASQSPRRGQLLDQIGVRHRLLLPRADEDAEALEAERIGELPAAYVERVTRAKLKAAGARLMAAGLPPAPIVCADTTVALGRRIFGKPRDAAEAVATLRLLSGRTHRVITAVAVAVARERLNAFGVPGGLHTPDKHEPPMAKKAHESHDMLESLAVSRSSVRFGVMPAAAIDAYVASGEPFGKAGAYAIQGAIAGWIERIDGSYSGIMGLPLFETAQLLRRAGIDC